MTMEEIEEKIAELQKKVDGVLSLLQKILNPDGKMDLNMKIEDLIVQVTNKGHVTVDISTSTADGKIMFCALSPNAFNREPFQYSTMRKCLLEQGWNMGDGTYSSALNGLVSKGLLIKEEKNYRLPAHVTFTGDELKGA